MKKKFSRSIMLTMVISLLIFATAYRDAVQVVYNYSYAPAINPSGIEKKVTFKDSIHFFLDTTLTRISCKISQNSKCIFNKPSKPVSSVRTNFYYLDNRELLVENKARSMVSLKVIDLNTLLIAHRNGILSFYDLKTNRIIQNLDLDIRFKLFSPNKIDGPLVGRNEADALGVRDILVYRFDGNYLELYYSFLTINTNGCLSMNLQKSEFTFGKNGIKTLKKSIPIWNNAGECITYENAHILGAGGKLAKYGENVVITLGDLNKVDRRINKTSSWGKTWLVRSSFNAREFTSGHRNPSGIVNVNNHIFEVEQGPQGGDELNKLLPGADYGYPLSNYGKNYSFGGYKSNENSHLFGREPLQAFVPSPAFSSIAVFFGKIPTYWKNSEETSDLFISSLKAQSIYRCRLRDKFTSVAYCEKIFIGEVIRDLVLIGDENKYRIYSLTDQGTIIVSELRN